MEATTLKLQTLHYNDVKTYLVTTLFVVGNILLPQLCHFIPNGGAILLPIFFFTIVGAYKYGWKVGLSVAVLSPLVNSLLFGMPLLTALPIIITKSVLLAVSASLAANYFKRVSILILALVVAFCQIMGIFCQWAITSDFILAVQSFRMAIPGMLLQIFGGYAFIKYLIRN